MPKTKKPTSPTKINPPQGWRDSEGIGFLGAQDTDGQRVPLLFVHDIAAWLLQQSKPLKLVTNEICEAIERHGLDGIFYTSADDFAHAYSTPSVWDKFVGGPNAKDLANRFRAAWLMPSWELERLVNTPEFPREFESASTTPFEFSRRNGNPLAAIAVTYDLANKLWGWGFDAGEVAKDQPATRDKDAQLLALLDAYEKKGRTTRAKFAQDHGLSEHNLKKQVLAAKKVREKNESNQYKSLIVAAGKVAKK